MSDEEVPDFAALYGQRSRAEPSMTPRMADWLWQTAILLADTWRVDREDLASHLQYLPPVARPFAQGVWLDRFIDCFDAVARRIARGDIDANGLPTCTGEEMALHIVIDLAEASLADEVLTRTGAVTARLPDHGADDENFERVRDVLFEDHDVLLLFDPSLDGIEDSEASQANRLVNLHPRDWFEPFSDT